MKQPTLALSSGEPAGVGPDLCVALARHDLAASVVVLGDIGLLRERVARLGADVDVRPMSAAGRWSRGTLWVEHVPLAAAVEPGRLDRANSRYVLELLDRAVAGCLEGRFDALVTAPVHKGIINDAGIPFTGHTEYLAERTSTPRVVMMLAGGGMRVALATTHLPLAAVPGAITATLLREVLEILNGGLRQQFGIPRPRILVTGLNPHAGESGHLGHEEIEVIEPVLRQLRGRGMNLVGPLPADTLFSRIRHEPCDAVLAMYHDQGLPVLKYASFGAGVNITLGLPIVRTSVDHGTALDLAGSGKADAGSLIAAIETACAMAAKTRPASSLLEGTPGKT